MNTRDQMVTPVGAPERSTGGAVEALRLVSTELAVLESVPVASQELIDARRLQRRIDTKFLLPRQNLPALLETLGAEFSLLRGPLAPFGSYRSIYFDSPELRTFHDHRRGLRRRFKVRIRHYLDRQLSFLEVKAKAGLITDKSRLEQDFMAPDFSDQDRAFLASSPAAELAELVPSLSSTYGRITLLGRTAEERLTLDFGLHAERDGRRADFGGAIIAEVKQPRFTRFSPAMNALRQQRAMSVRVSKYCAGLMALDSALRGNRLKPRLRALLAMNHG